VALVLKSAAFRAEREASWRELEALVRLAERRGVRALAAAELSRLPMLYRGALSSLSVARAISLDKGLLQYLESLCTRAYLVVYGTRRHLGEAVGEFLASRFPRVVREHRWHLLLAALLLAAGGLTGFALVLSDLDRFHDFVPAAMAQGRGPGASTEALRDVLYSRKDAGALLTAFAMFLFGHNAQIGFLAFALGFAGGVPTFLVLFSNGLSLGALAALYHQRGLSLELWAWLLPHGVTELAAVVLCGAAGLAVGQALVFPGRRTRLAALAGRGRGAGELVMGSVALFLVAALVEGIFRQRVHAVGVRYAVAGLFALGWGLYFLWPRRVR